MKSDEEHWTRVACGFRLMGEVSPPGGLLLAAAIFDDAQLLVDDASRRWFAGVAAAGGDDRDVAKLAQAGNECRRFALA
ncbi:hypothetical protein HNQ96_000201 [Aminobacter lissarensis]|uniref:Uncharacterized protein n=1 Tax=Aminobacter carboxidus TaxID=376165 RepID=A0A8E1WAE8_9HYPH|nr:hypothetical protein [Aminobacter lissarensis]MBB6464354.1 hypothetical protein [Aminobacter lissarensis]